MITKEEYEEIQARLEAATPGEWKLDSGLLGGINSVVCDKGSICEVVRRREDARFIAHAPEDMRKLLNSLGEMETWDDGDCNTCPLRGWEKCDEICASKSTMADHISKLGDDIDIKLAALMKAEAERDYYKRRAETLERAVKQFPDSCWFCINVSGCHDDCAFEFDEARFSTGGDGE